MEENEKDMNNYGGGIGASDAAVLALLADTSRAGRGGGYGGGYGEGGGYGGYGLFGGPASNAVRIDRNNDSTIRNGQDAHFFELSSQARSDFNILNLQAQNTALASQAQISQLALQMCECCGDTKAALGRIEGRLDCLEKNVTNEINLCINNQTIADLRAQLSGMQHSNGNGNGWPYVTVPTVGPPFGGGPSANGVAT